MQRLDTWPLANVGHNYHGSRDYGPQSRDFYALRPAMRYRKTDYGRRDQQYYGNVVDTSMLRGFESSEGQRDYMAYSQYYDYRPRNGHDKYAYDVVGNGAKPKKKPNHRGDSDNTKKDETFKEDYDFETANAIIAKELANLHIAQVGRLFCVISVGRSFIGWVWEGNILYHVGV